MFIKRPVKKITKNEKYTENYSNSVEWKPTHTISFQLIIPMHCIGNSLDKTRLLFTLCTILLHFGPLYDEKPLVTTIESAENSNY